MITAIIAQATETVPAETGEVVETVIDALTAAAAVLPMPWSAIAAGVLGLAGTIWAWKKRGNKKDK